MVVSIAYTSFKLAEKAFGTTKFKIKITELSKYVAQWELNGKFLLLSPSFTVDPDDVCTCQIILVRYAIKMQAH